MHVDPGGIENSPDDTLAGESGEYSAVQNFHERLRRYQKAHSRAVDMGNYITSLVKSNTNLAHSLAGLAPRLAMCGEYLVFRDYYTVKQVRLHHANFCKNHLLCPLCAIRRASKLTERYLDRSKEIQAYDGQIKPYFITLTLKDREDLGEMLQEAKRALAVMVNHRRQASHGRRPPIQMNKACAGVSAFEIKRGKGSGLWHVHIHAIWLCSSKPWESELSREWKEITGDSFIVDCRPVNDAMGFIEVLSYAVKFSTMTVDENFEAYKILRGKRLVNSFGWFRGIGEPEILEDEPLEDLPFIEMIFKYLDGAGYKLQPNRMQELPVSDRVLEMEVPY